MDTHTADIYVKCEITEESFFLNPREESFNHFAKCEENGTTDSIYLPMKCEMQEEHGTLEYNTNFENTSNEEKGYANNDGRTVRVAVEQDSQLITAVNIAPKRKHRTLTLSEKAKIVEQLKNGISGKQLAKQYGVGSSTISDIKKKEKKIESFIAHYDNTCGARKTLKNAEYPKMEEKLYAWFLLQRSTETSISYDSLAKQAKYFYKICYGNDHFRASNGWIVNFRKRHGLRLFKVGGDKILNKVCPAEDSEKTWKESETRQTKGSIMLPSVNQSEEVTQKISKTVQNETAVHSFDICLKWAEENEVSIQQIATLRGLRKNAFLLSQRDATQSRATNS